jgi:hypothetical protein
MLKEICRQNGAAARFRVALVRFFTDSTGVKKKRSFPHAPTA